MACIYVIELNKEVLKRKKFLKANPNYIPGKDCYYVGFSSKTPEIRFEQHISAYRTAKGHKRFSNIARDFGIKLRPRHYSYINNNKIFSKSDAKYWEIEKTRRLRNNGYGVWQK